jgi:hypothetical protein
MAEAFVTISINKKGEIQRVKRGRVAVRNKKGVAGKKVLGAGARVVKRVALEFLVHGAPTTKTKRKGSGGGKGKGRGKGKGGGTDPCCFRDGTGRVWCWC